LPKIVNSLFQTVGLIESEGLISVDEFYAHLGGKVCGETRNRNVCLRRKFSAKLVKRIQLIAATCLFPKKSGSASFFSRQILRLRFLQGCQMVYFQTENPNLGDFRRDLH
jgi:hypothetical protein